MKVQARIEKELFKAQEQYNKLPNILEGTKQDYLENIKYSERIKALKWILSDLDKDLD